MGAWFIRAIIALATTAVVRGVVMAFHLDAMVARIINVAETNSNLEAIAWSLSGVTGLIAVFIWIALGAPERLASLFWPRPALGSLSYQMFENHAAIHGGAETAPMELVVLLNNQNEKLVRYRAVISGAVNGANWQDENGNQQLSVDGFVPAKETRSLILNIPNVPITFIGSTVRMDGRFVYSIEYFFPPHFRRFRTTARTVTFNQQVTLSGVSGITATPMRVLFRDEREE
ncbi:hypothetical protein [Hyphomicrobium sp. MC1]|uniref:hypothetical protein n=1 Tax=Hyphomicrobium sp. (strain MC1) TaxID=717785 RepID=UPI000213E49B|nr:hypothetical protein [Hyphomicrobium sp. MC1]CCB67714.1 protein of unknown function [Hyphomicrobium sp. MC1]